MEKKRNFLKAKEHYSNRYLLTINRLERYLTLFSVGGFTITLPFLLKHKAELHHRELLLLIMMCFLISIFMNLSIIIIDFFAIRTRLNDLSKAYKSTIPISIRKIESNSIYYYNIQFFLGIFSVLLILIGTIFGIIFLFIGK